QSFRNLVIAINVYAVGSDASRHECWSASGYRRTADLKTIDRHRYSKPTSDSCLSVVVFRLRLTAENMSVLTQAQTDRGKALVVDDDPIVRRFISAVLRMSGFQVLEANDAIQALVVFQAGGSAVNLVITDVK